MIKNPPKVRGRGKPKSARIKSGLEKNSKKKRKVPPVDYGQKLKKFKSQSSQNKQKEKPICIRLRKE